MFNPRITTRHYTPVGGELDTSDLQGVGLYRGKEIKRSKLSEEIDFGVHADEDDQEGKSSGSTKGELKIKFQEREKQAFSDQEENLPDFEEFANSPEFKKFMAQLRKGQRSETYEEIQEALDTTFDDPTLKHAALVGAIKLLEGQADQEELKELLQQILKDLLESSGAEVRAGYNVSRVAESIAKGETDLIAQLRDFYCQVVFSDQSLVDTYHAIMNDFPDQVEREKREKEKKNKQQYVPEEVDGPEGEARLEKALEFLMKSLGAELKSNRPSLEPSMLKKVLDGLCEMEFFRNTYRSFLDMLTKLNKDCNAVPIKPSRLINEILKRVLQDKISDEDFLKVAQQFGVPPLQLSIHFLTRIYEMVRLFPERIFPSGKNREVCLTAIQHALDSAIARESEVA
jgi:type III secretion system TyeA family effector delivery regulator